MNPVEPWNTALAHTLGRLDVRGDHALLDDAMTHEAICDMHIDDLATLIELDFCLR